MIYELRGALDDEEDDAVRDDIRRVLRMLSGRPDLTHRSATEVNALLQTPPYSLPPPVPSALPPFAPYEEPPPGTSKRRPNPNRAGGSASDEPPRPAADELRRWTGVANLYEPFQSGLA
jgi:hypothetical protein